MPYIYYLNNKRYIICSILIHGYWKLHIYNEITKEFKRINTNTQFYVNECNPQVFIENNECYLSYTNNPIAFAIDIKKANRAIYLGKYN
jgi:hypothetical protein